MFNVVIPTPKEALHVSYFKKASELAAMGNGMKINMQKALALFFYNDKKPLNDVVSSRVKGKLWVFESCKILCR